MGSVPAVDSAAELPLTGEQQQQFPLQQKPLWPSMADAGDDFDIELKFLLVGDSGEAARFCWLDGPGRSKRGGEWCRSGTSSRAASLHASAATAPANTARSQGSPRMRT